MTHSLTSDGGQHFSSRDAELLADLRQHRGINLGGVSVARQREEVRREVLLEPLVFPDALDGDTLHRVHLGGGGGGEEGRRGGGGGGGRREEGGRRRGRREEGGGRRGGGRRGGGMKSIITLCILCIGTCTVASPCP